MLRRPYGSDPVLSATSCGFSAEQYTLLCSMATEAVQTCLADAQPQHSRGLEGKAMSRGLWAAQSHKDCSALRGRPTPHAPLRKTTAVSHCSRGRPTIDRRAQTKGPETALCVCVHYTPRCTAAKQHTRVVSVPRPTHKQPSTVRAGKEQETSKPV